MQDQIKNPNKLINEKSPYLLQHAYNPVDWYPWCQEAFDRAKRENKPIFLSIGYSTCHWCHVMEHESFGDDEVAKLLNDICVSIKVDREERPDIDNVYMSVCQILIGSGGWPLNIFMTHDKKPFFAGTYFPKETLFGRIGMLDLLPKIKEVWTNKHQDVLESASQITDILQQISLPSKGKNLEPSVLEHAYELLSNYFHENGGFGGAPKFPTPHNLLFLLRYYMHTKDDRSLYMVEKTLEAMRLGGIYDHIGFGFHRYSTDSQWLVPHFEKMLYDQALLGLAYTEAFQVTRKQVYKETACEIFEYVLRDMKAKDGGFYSAEDADSEGVEGKFYVWTEDEIRKVVGESEADLFISTFNVKKDGNYYEEATRKKTTSNILHLTQWIKDENIKSYIEEKRKMLFKARETRIHPHKDDKILLSWNGLMIAALAKAAQVFNEPIYLTEAKSAFEFIMKNLYNSGDLIHSFRDNKSNIKGYLDDYAFFIWGLIELYEATFEVKYIQLAVELTEKLYLNFWDKKYGGFYFTSSLDESLIVRRKEIYDGAIPSGNSVSMLNLTKLSRLTGNVFYDKLLEEIKCVFSNQINESPISHTMSLVALSLAFYGVSEVVIVGNIQSKDTIVMLNSLRKKYLPNKVILLKSDDETKDISKIANFTKPYTQIDMKATAYICENFKCKQPTCNVDEMLEMLIPQV